LFENPGVIEVHELFVYSENHSLVHKQHSSDPLGEKSSMLFWREKNRDFDTK
jgi:hypothetical protein